MVRPNRIKEYSFSIGSLTAASTGRFDVYSDHVINGMVQKIVYVDGNYAANGSLFVFVSGVNSDQLWLYKDAVADQVVYPFAYPVDNANTTGSPHVGVQPVMNSTLRIVGSGVGAGTSGLGLKVYYI